MIYTTCSHQSPVYVIRSHVMHVMRHVWSCRPSFTGHGTGTPTVAVTDQPDIYNPVSPLATQLFFFFFLFACFLLSPLLLKVPRRRTESVAKRTRRADTGASALPFSSFFDPRALNPKTSQLQNGAAEPSASYPLIDHLYSFPLLVLSISFLPRLTRATPSRYSTSYVRSIPFHLGYPPP